MSDEQPAAVAQTVKIYSRWDGSLLREFPGATVKEALENAARSGASLDRASLDGASLDGASLVGASLPSPGVMLVAYWGDLSEATTIALMRLDASAHPDPSAFDRWAAGGACPYQDCRVERAARFTERDHAETVVHVGIDWSEAHRFDRLRDRRAPWVYEAPLCSAPYLTKTAMLQEARSAGIAPPYLYSLGFAHNNCGGGCVKAGIGHFAHLLATLPDVFADWESREAELRQFLGRDDIAILRDRRGGQSAPMTLAQLRARIEGGGEVDRFEIGGCGCFADVEAA